MGLCQGNERKAKKSTKKNERTGNFDANELKNDLILEINAIREIHQVDGLSPSREIESIAQSFANKVAKKGDLDYSNNTYNGEELGEILFYYSSDCDAETVIETWNEDSKNFKYNSKNPEASSFAQIVWKSSKYIGLGISKDSKGATYIVANFYPAGNVVGQFKDNVFPPKGKGGSSNKKKEKEKEVKKSKKDTNKSSNLSGYTQFDIDALEAHNFYRKRHHAPPLTLNKDLCKIAQNYAQKLLATNTFDHSTNKYNGKSIGENLFYCKGKEATGEMATTDWYNEIKMHNFRKEFQSATGHFTQVIWKGTEEVGFGIANKGNTYYVVANYFPAGNVMGEFATNVLKA